MLIAFVNNFDPVQARQNIRPDIDPNYFTLNRLIFLTEFILKNIWNRQKNTKNFPACRAVEIPCATCPTWPHFIQDKLKISTHLSLDKCKICYKVNKILYFIFRLVIISSHVALKTVWIYTVYMRVDICMVSYFCKCKLGIS